MLSKAVQVCWTFDALSAPSTLTKSFERLHPAGPLICCACVQVSTVLFFRGQQHSRALLVTQQAADKFIPHLGFISKPRSNLNPKP